MKSTTINKWFGTLPQTEPQKIKKLRGVFNTAICSCGAIEQTELQRILEEIPNYSQIEVNKVRDIMILIKSRALINIKHVKKKLGLT